MEACKETLTTVLDEREGRGSPKSHRLLMEHAKTCPACAQAVDDWTTAIPALRDLTGAGVSDTSLKRMENAIVSELARPAVAVPARRLRIPLAVAASAVLAIGLPLLSRLQSEPRFARIQSQWGAVTRANHPVRPGDTLRPGETLSISVDGETSLSIGRGVDARLLGPARLSLEGDPSHPNLRLDAGRIFVRVDKRQPNETLRVQTAHGHVEVRGTCFVVGYEGTRSFVRVDEGEVAAFRVASTEATLVRAGDTHWLAAPAAPEAPQPSTTDAVESAPQTSAPIEPSCDDRILAARKAMRSDRPQKALAIVEDALSINEGRRASRCQDELGYLRAEALRLAGSTDQAIAAFKSLDRPNATPTMRQNALYAAGQLEARKGAWKQAGRLFDRAFGTHPEGPLAEDSLGAAVDAVVRSGADAREVARRYIERFPTGVAAARARSIVSPSPPR